MATFENFNEKSQLISGTFYNIVFSQQATPSTQADEFDPKTAAIKEEGNRHYNVSDFQRAVTAYSKCLGNANAIVYHFVCLYLFICLFIVRNFTINILLSKKIARRTQVVLNQKGIGFDLNFSQI